MKKVIWIVLFVGFIVSLIVISVILNNSNKSINDESVSSGNTINASNSQVLNVSSSNFNDEVLNSDKPVLIDFYADWCGPCKILSPTVEQIAKENSNIKAVKINVDLEQDLAQKYAIRSIPTLVFIKNGVEVDRAIGALNKNQILSIINK